MKRRAALVLTLVSVTGLAAWARADEPKPTEPKGPDVPKLIEQLTGRAEAPRRTPEQLAAAYGSVLDALAPQVGGEDLGRRREAEGVIERMCHRAARPKAEGERLALCKAMLARLGAKTPKAMRVWLLRMLQHTGKGEAAGALAKLLGDEDAQVRECARRALQANASAEAGAVLRAQLAAAKDPPWRVAIINALGYRRDPAAAGALTQALRSKDEAVVLAAAGALGKIGGTEAARALKSARGRGSAAVRGGVVDAYLLCADRLAAAGKTGPAVAIYEEMYAPREPRRVRVAALAGLSRASPGKAAPRVVELLRGADAALRQAAVLLVRETPGAAATKAFAAASAKLPPPVQALVLEALGERGDPLAAGAVRAAVAGKDPAVRLAAVRALGALGDASDIRLLAKTATGGGEAKAASASLDRLKGKDVDRAMVDAMRQAQGAVRVELIRSLGARRAQAAIPALFASAEGSDQAVRIAALKSLGAVAGEGDLPRLVKLLVAARTAQERQAAENAVASACARASADKDRRARAVLAALGTATGDVRSSLLRVLGRIQGPKAMAALRQAAGDKDQQVRDLAVRALAGWSDGSAAPTLLEIARKTSTEAHAVLALRGYVRLAGQRGRKDAEKLKMLRQALEVARRPAERKLVLAGLSNVRNAAALDMAAPLLDDKAVAEEAAAAVVNIARRMKIDGGNVERVRAAMEKALAVATSGGTRKRAQEVLGKAKRVKPATPKTKK